ncbi:MAG: hypothetical protein K2K83_00545 [Rikenella sp.]|nr:hypothetical protein [Rikenella sp.]
MKTKRLLFSVLLFCGMVAFATVWARPDSSQPAESKFDPDQVMVAVGMTGLESGSVDIQIVFDNGKTYFLTGSANGFIGEFLLESNSFDVELFFHNTSPAFSRLTTSATLEFTQVSDTKYHVTVYDKWITFGEIGLHFGNF